MAAAPEGGVNVVPSALIARASTASSSSTVTWAHPRSQHKISEARRQIAGQRLGSQIVLLLPASLAPDFEMRPHADQKTVFSNWAYSRNSGAIRMRPAESGSSVRALPTSTRLIEAARGSRLEALRIWSRIGCQAGDG
jgi:hypothetical protein